MENRPPEKWYFKLPILIIAFLCVGPFALPLVWFNPRFSRKTKIITTVVVLLLTYYLWCALANSLKSINQYYQAILQGTL